MRPARISVLLPCHSPEDFPSWLEGDEARDLLDAWTAAWHPSLIALAGGIPAWESLERPPDDREATLFFVPASFDDRLAGTGLEATAEAVVVRNAHGRAAIVEAARAACDHDDAPAIPLADDFHALGLAWLLSELLSRRMRSSLAIDQETFREAAVAAARAAVAGDEPTARARLGECFETLASSRKRYYPVDIWLLDVVLLAGSTLGDELGRELSREGSLTIVASGEVVERLTTARPDLAETLRGRLAAGALAAATGLWDDSPIHRMTPEAILASLERSRDAWHRATGTAPTTFARRSGGFSAILPQVLGAVGFDGCLYRLFDGSRLPDPGSSRIRWEGPSGAAIEAVSCEPLDARSPQTALMLAESIGQVLDHSHSATVLFAHYPGTADTWFDDFRRIASHADVFGRFVSPEHLFRETAGAGVRADFEPDAFADPPPRAAPDAGGAADDPVARALEDARASARAIAEATAHRLACIAAIGVSSSTAEGEPSPAAVSAGTTREAVPRPDRGHDRSGNRGRGAGWLGGFFAPARSRDRDASLLLEAEGVSLKVHPQTGGILSLRRPGGPNRLSQQLAVRSTRPLETGARWEDPLDRADYTEMIADAVERASGPDGRPSIESRGRLVDGDRPLGTFRQSVWIDAARPIVMVDVRIDLERPIPTPRENASPLEAYAASRFAWNENEDIELFRSLHTQSAATERTHFSADHFIELRGSGCAILTAGLAWHVRSSPHMLDTVLLAAGRTSAQHRFGIGLGLESPWESGLALLADPGPTIGDIAVAPSARITGGTPIVEGGRTVGIRVGVLESRGSGGRARLCPPIGIVEAWRIDARGRRERPLAVENGEVTLELARYEWAMIELRTDAASPEAAS